MIRIIKPDWRNCTTFKDGESIVFVYYSAPTCYQQVEYGHVGNGNYKVEKLDGTIWRREVTSNDR